MIKIENTEVVGWEAAIRGMRNPKNSHQKCDSLSCKDCYNLELDMDNDGNKLCDNCGGFKIGPNDHNLMMSLANGGPVHAKYRRMIVVYVDITAPLYWWSEYDTYKVGTVTNSCSKMHTIQDKKFTLDDFSHEHLDKVSLDTLNYIITQLEYDRLKFLKTKDKKYWWQMIQLLPTSYNQRRTVMLNYEVLAGIYPMRKNHKLDEWHDFCQWIEKLPYSEIIIGEEK